MFETRFARTGGAADVDTQLIRGLLTGLVCVILLLIGFPGKAIIWSDNRLVVADGRVVLGGTVLILDVAVLGLLG
jgi:hypothetical protein